MPEKQSKRSKVTLNILTIFQLAVDLISVCIFIARFESSQFTFVSRWTSVLHFICYGIEFLEVFPGSSFCFSSFFPFFFACVRGAQRGVWATYLPSVVAGLRNEMKSNAVD